MADEFDVVVIGGGPGGYVCAIRAGQLGLKTACVEMRGALGGTCLNVGCVPSKALLHASEVFEHAGDHFARLGVKTQGVELDLDAMMAHKDKIVGELTKGVAFLLKKNKVEAIAGRGALKGGGVVEVAPVDGGDGPTRTLKAKAIVIATGSEVTPLPGVEIDEERILSSTGALALKAVPKRLAVVGAGVIGLELGSVWRRLGAEVTVIEFLDRITPAMDGEVAKQLQKMLEKQGIAFRLSTKVAGVEATKKELKLSLEPAKGDGDGETLAADAVLVAIGRRPYTAGLGLDAAGVALDDKGRITTDAGFATSAKGVYAIGDAIAGPMLAHKAEDEGVALAEALAGQKPHINYDAIPNVIYTAPEVASVGKTEEELKAAGVKYRAGKFAYMANARAKGALATDGFVKILADAATDRILGMHIIGAQAGEMIHEGAIAIEFGASAEDLARTCHAHPTLSEIVKEAALAVDKRAIHS